MMFVISKLLSGFLQPLNGIFGLLVLGLLLGRRRPAWGRRLMWLAVALFALVGFEALPDALLRKLESRYPVPPDETLGRYRGVIVLGGALELPPLYQAHGQVALNEAAERLTVPTGWLRRYPSMQLLFSGGEAALQPTGTSEASLARLYFSEQGIDPLRLELEDRSRTTRENARAVAEKLGANCGRDRLLVTSAFHMPRAMAEFEAAGCPATPYPVDFRTGRSTPLDAWSLTGGPTRWYLALHEWVGILAYRATARPTKPR